MGKLEILKNKYPQQVNQVCGQPFKYRYFRNPVSDQTVVLLTGGIGMSDLMLFHFEELAKSFSVITFDYPRGYPTNRELIDAIAALFRILDIKGYLIGQSLGGFIAQLLAKHHPDVVAGLILSNTGTLAAELSPTGRKCLTDMLKHSGKLLTLLKWLPFGPIKSSMKRSILKMVDESFESDIIDEVIGEVTVSLTKEEQIHMILLMKDLENHWDMSRADFAGFRNKVLLILSDDDHTFHDDVKQALIEIMPEPVVVTDIRGGHLALMLKIDRYIRVVADFVKADI